MTFDIKIDNTTIPITSEDIDRYNFSHITGLNLTIGKSLTKNDQEGHGTQYYYDVKSNNNVDSPLIPQYCFVRSMYELACICKAKKGESLFTCNTDKKKWKLTYEHYGAAVKAAAKLAGVTDLSGYTPKSTRVGATTTLAAQNVPDYTIKALGRWTSLAFMIYIRTSLKQFGEAMNILTNINSFTLREAIQCNPRLSA
jgi:hypothetical protein